MRKLAFCICENIDADQLHGKLISTFVLTTYKVHSLYLLNPDFKPLNIFSDCSAHLCGTWLETRKTCFLVLVLGFYVPPTAKVIWGRDLGLKSHPKDWRSPRSNSRPLVYKASSLTTTPRMLLGLLVTQLI